MLIKASGFLVPVIVEVGVTDKDFGRFVVA